MSHTTGNTFGALSLAVADRTRAAVEAVARHGASGPAALVALDGYAGGESIDSLRRILGITHSGAVRLVDRLAAAGLVERRVGPDARAVSIHLTPVGRRTARRVLAAREAAGKVPGRWSPVIRWIVTFHIVCLGWVFFRAESFGNAFSLLWRLVAAPGIGDAVTPMLVFVIAAMIASQFVPTDVVSRAQAVFSRSMPALQAVALAVGLLIIDALGPEGVPPFIYFQF